MPTPFGVPLSNLSGQSSGWISNSERLPVPPRNSGSMSTVSTRSPITRPPVPGGPSKALWPVNASRSMPCACMSMGTAPAVCAASTSSSAPARWASAATCAIGRMVPMTLLAWLSTTSRVPG